MLWAFLIKREKRACFPQSTAYAKNSQLCFEISWVFDKRLSEGLSVAKFPPDPS